VKVSPGLTIESWLATEMSEEFTRFSPCMALNPDVGRARYPVSAVISDLPLFTTTTASLDAPSPGPTSFLMELLLLLTDVEDVDVDLSYLSNMLLGMKDFCLLMSCLY